MAIIKMKSNDMFGVYVQLHKTVRYKDSYEQRCKDNPHTCETSDWCTHPDCKDPIMQVLGESFRMYEEENNQK